MTRDPTPAASGRRPARLAQRRGFTLAELLVVAGLIAMLSSLLLPVLGKARAAANATKCLSNVRQMSTAWTMYAAASRGQLPTHLFGTVPGKPDLPWNGSWLGLLDANAVRGEVLLCPAAGEPVPTPDTGGIGRVDYAWNGKFASTGTAVRLTPTSFRTGSYGFNRFLTAGRKENHLANKLTAFRDLSEMPMFFDCTFVDAEPENGTEQDPAPPPPNLRGDGVMADPLQTHWRFLLARHGRAINIAFADGSARRVALDDTYHLRWHMTWVPYRIPLPSN
jgi:prepilin-type N-terminal cleavage/methylation domain-containing protein/prepilin-type processing-associated H-X9-DG protein